VLSGSQERKEKEEIVQERPGETKKINTIEFIIVV
jgi:hypothetical protein